MPRGKGHRRGGWPVAEVKREGSNMCLAGASPIGLYWDETTDTANVGRWTGAGIT